MYDLIRPPTDNLYKFAALAGLSAYVLAFGFLSMRASALGLEAVTVEGEVALAEHETARLAEELEGLRVLSEAVPALTVDSALKLSPEDAAEYLERAGVLRTSLDALHERSQEHRRSLVELKNRTARLVFLQEDLARLRRWGGVLAGLSLGLSVWGFGMWYFRHQRYEDMRVRAAAGVAPHGLTEPAMAPGTQPASDSVRQVDAVKAPLPLTSDEKANTG